MNMPAHISGQISGQVPNQVGAQFHGLSHPNGNPLQTQMHNLGGQRNTIIMESDNEIRNYMREKILECLLKKNRNYSAAPQDRISDIVRRLDDGLLKFATTKEEYLNLATLESRLLVLTRRLRDPAQSSQLVNSSSAIGAMIPTPGMSHNNNSNMMPPASANSIMVQEASSNNISSSNGSSGRLMQSTNGSYPGTFHSAEGSRANGFHQASSNFSMGGNVNASVVEPRAASQMIPTPGFSSNNTNSITNVESATNGGGFSGVDSSVTLQQMPQRQNVGGKNSRVLQNLGSQIGAGVRSTMQQRSFAFNNGSVNGGFGNRLQLVNASGSSENYMNSTAFAGSSTPLQQQFDHHQRPLMQGDGSGLATTDPNSSGTIYGPSTTVGSVINTQNLNQVRLQPNMVAGNQSTMQDIQSSSHLRRQTDEQDERSKFQIVQPSQENISRFRQQYQNQPNQFQHQHQHQQQQQQQQQFVSHNRLHKQLNEQTPITVKTEASIQFPLSADARNHVKVESEIDGPNEVFHPQVSGSFQVSEFQSQFQPSLSDTYTMSGQYASLPPVHQEISAAVSSDAQMLMQPQHFAAEAQAGVNGLSSVAQPEMIMQGQWHTESVNNAALSGNLLHDQRVQDAYSQRLGNHDVAHLNNLPSDGPLSAQAIVARNTAAPPSSGIASYGPENANLERQYKNQQRWLLLLYHARACHAANGKCPLRYCMFLQKLWLHIKGCKALDCPYPRCLQSKRLIDHSRQCKNPQCSVCKPACNFIISQMKAHAWQDSNSSLPYPVGGNCKPPTIEANVPLLKSSQILETKEDPHHAMKRLKLELPSDSIIPEPGPLSASFNTKNESQVLMDMQPQFLNTSMQIKPELPEVKLESCAGSASPLTEMKMDIDDAVCNQKPDVPFILCDPVSTKQETVITQAKQENGVQPEYGTSGTKSGKPNIKGVSLVELFTPEQVREHITGLRQWVGQSKAKAEKNQAMEQTMSENSCQLCAVEKLTFEPPPIYCTPCGARIKRNNMYYTIGSGDTRHYFCIPCYNDARGDTIVVDGATMSKARMEKKKNDEETEEWWVQCDKCEAWQHQICALFNGRRNDGGQAEYTCPNCYIQEVERGERKPLPQSAVLGAKDLPRTILSDHIEQRLFKKLKQERTERAKQQGKSYDEVPGAEGIVVRVVSSVDKKLDVKPRFLEIFREENYPSEFPYKLKVVLLFQKIEGVEVCLFGMYVQEFGAECELPNQRRVYLSYLDSVKYFRPEVKAVTGEALRTYVYHEILIGYLEYCKKRGFSSCYIWACPPLKGEDYILYCHPEIQKTPKSDKLREWYLSMLRKAIKESIVVELTNLYDHFFQSSGECKAKVTAARLPYFDGDYWPGAAEDMIYQLNQEEEGRKLNKKGTIKKAITKRALKASGQIDLSSNASKDLLLMHKLGETITHMKEDFIMVHLTYSCTHCCALMVSGNRWVCRQQCKNFQLCDKCYEAEQKIDDRERHPINQKEKHTLFPVEIVDVPEDTKDKDEILESEFFDTRQAFLSLCQGNHYQYDTLRRAKHSSMMVLYHLHNPTAPAFVITCNVCHLDIETGQGWRCETCSDYDVCNACYQKDGGIDHPHKLTNHPSIAERDAQNKEARQIRVIQLRKMLDLLVHASQCRSALCSYPNCRKVKGLFRHGIQCKVRASGGCVTCKKMWYLLQLHSRACKEAECNVPRCRDLREHLRRLQQQSDSRRRAAVMEMMRQRAAEVAGNGG